MEFQTGQALAQDLGGFHLLVTNAADPTAATEFALLRLSLSSPADELTGPEGHTSARLSDAEAVFGTKTPTGFATAGAVVPSGFESWISTRLGENYSDHDRLPDADPDGDGWVNLLEYAVGAPPDNGVLTACLSLEQDPGGTARVVYLRRVGSEGIRFRIDFREAPGGGDWTKLASSVAVATELASSAPEGCEWVWQTLPAADRGFVRLRVEVVP